MASGIKKSSKFNGTSCKNDKISLMSHRYNIQQKCRLNSRLTVLQKQAIRVVSRSSCDAHTDPIFKELKFLKTNSIELLQLGQFMYSFNTGSFPPKFDSFFSVNNSIHSYNTRHASFFRLPLCKTNIRQSFISFQGPKFFNTLSSQTKHTPTLMSFKHKLKDFLINSY